MLCCILTNITYKFLYTRSLSRYVALLLGPCGAITLALRYFGDFNNFTDDDDVDNDDDDSLNMSDLVWTEHV